MVSYTGSGMMGGEHVDDEFAIEAAVGNRRDEPGAGAQGQPGMAVRHVGRLAEKRQDRAMAARVAIHYQRNEAALDGGRSPA